MQNFKAKVLAFVKLVPTGRVVSYGQVAVTIGYPRAARQVGFVLWSISVDSLFPARIHSALETPRNGRYRKGKPFLGFPSEVIPWWRVLSSQGIISIKGNWVATKELQKALLEKEGIVVNKNFDLDIKKYRWLGGRRRYQKIKAK
jgi:methylated-DNA-protein-cysteine methyltransferase-like protein